MKFGIVTTAGSVDDYVEMAREAETCGWDGVFVWDDISVGPQEVFDPWVTLGAIATVTHRITIGAMVFSLARRRPWKVARESLTLDRLSAGRLVLPVGLGGTWDGGYSRVNTEDPARKVRAEKLDECLQILELAWTGEPFSYAGTHYRADDLQFLPHPVQQPAIPIWPVGAWPHRASLARAARHNGIVVSDMSLGADQDAPLRAETVRAVATWVAENRGPEAADDPFDIVTEGQTPGADTAAARAVVEPLAEAGATWFVESRWGEDETAETLLNRIKQGPPSFDR